MYYLQYRSYLRTRGRRITRQNAVDTGRHSFRLSWTFGSTTIAVAASLKQ